MWYFSKLTYVPKLKEYDALFLENENLNQYPSEACHRAQGLWPDINFPNKHALIT